MGDFFIKCFCGNEINGYFDTEDQDERLYCKCGLNWYIPRPKSDEEDEEDEE